jgi:hypothetical protein
MNIAQLIQQAQAKRPITSKSPGEQFAAEGDQVLAQSQQAATDATASRQSLLTMLTGGQQAFETSAKAAVDAAMPSFQGQLQGVRESALRRGVQNGELGTSYEGDLASAFDQHTKQAIAGQALGLYNTQLGASQDLYGVDTRRAQDSRDSYLDILTARGDWDRVNAEQNHKKKSGIGGMIGGAIGGVGGFLLGGPAGAITGAKIGSGVGGRIGGGGY